MNSLFDKVSGECSKLTTKTYSTSFSLGIFFLSRPLRDPIYAIYGFVRFADEIVDSFHGYRKEELLHSFRKDTDTAIRDKISLNPILNSFQFVVHKYNIRKQWIDIFLDSMAMDLQHLEYDDGRYQKYIFGSAEVVGLMCLHVFAEGSEELFEKLKPYAMKLGAAFQKVNFLRDVQADNLLLGRTYFPNVDLRNFSKREKQSVEREIEADFAEALKGIKMLPLSSQSGVYMAYYYYLALFKKIKRLPAEKVLNERVRIANFQKLLLMLTSNLRYKLNII
jgi:15-cis-phytoene synthase